MVSRHPGSVKPARARDLPWVVLALGSNLGDRPALLAFARDRLAAAGFRWQLASRVVETAPCGGPPGQQPYLNQVLAAPCAAAPADPRCLLAICQQIELQAGRRRSVRWGPRTLDIDILIHGLVELSAPDLTVPHPRLAERAFVLAPLVEILPDLAIPPEGRTPRELLARLPERKPASAPGRLPDTRRSP